MIVDLIRSKLVWEVPQYPAYYFPMADVRMHHLAESDRKQRSSSCGEARYFDVHGGNRMASNSAWHYPELPVFDIEGTYVSNGIRWTLGLRKRKKCSSTPTIRTSASTFCTVLATSRFRSMA